MSYSQLPKIDSVSYKLWCQLPAQRLTYYTAFFLAQNSKLKKALQDTITPYLKDDWDQRNLPALSVYSKEEHNTDNTWLYEGTLYLKFHLPLSAVRERQHEVAAVLSGGLNLILEQDYVFSNNMFNNMPGLRRLGWITKTDFSQIEEIVTKDVLTMTMEIDFAIDKLVWLNYIYNEVGATAFDPCTPVYGTIESFELFVYPSIFPAPTP